jgi:hypothetical protein
LDSGTKNNFQFPHNLNSINLPIRTANVGIKIVLESRSINFTKFGFNVGGIYLAKEEQNERFGA